MHRIKSFFLSLFIHIIRFADHIYRMLAGLPQLSRSEITPHLYLGGQYNTRGLAQLKQLGVTGIISMRESLPKKHESNKFFNILHLPTKDLHPPAIKDFQKGVTFIEDQIQDGGKVYMHCRLGEGRGPSMMMAYLIRTGLTFEDALHLIKDVRPFVQLTKKQAKQLKKWEKLQN